MQESLGDKMKAQLKHFLTKREGDDKVAPIAPLINRDSTTPLQDTRDKDTGDNKDTGISSQD